MFCRNCGSQLTEGAKFCSECGTKVEDIRVREFDNPEIEEPEAVTDTFSSAPIGADEAFNSRVSFDWSNVIDEPQKKEIPQGIKSPWASTTGSIDERMIHSEMTPSDDKNRTMSFIDVLKADKEERERAALDRSIEYTEVLEIDPEVVGGTKPPTLHVAPLYDDVDEPVVTPFDVAEDDAETASTSAPKFELPDFLKKAVGFGAGKVEKDQPEASADDVAVIEDTDTNAEVEKEAAAEEAEDYEPANTAEDAAATSVEADSEPAEPAESAEEEYLDEDIYLDLEERPSDEARMSRVDTHTLAGDYDFFDDEDDDQSEETADELIEEQAEEPSDEGAIDEAAFFAEIGSKEASEPGKTGMTIAAPADEEAEIEALKRRLAELTGTVEIDPALLDEADASVEADPEPSIDAEPDRKSEPEIEAEPEEPEPVFGDFTFEPEITESEDALFAGLTAASETASEPKTEIPEESAEYASEGSIEDLYLSDEFAFEPEVTEADDALFAGLTAASEPAAEEAEEPETEISAAVETETLTEEPREEVSLEYIGEESAAEPSFGLSDEDELVVEKFTEAETEPEPVSFEPEENFTQPAEEAAEEAAESVPEEATEKAEPSVEDLLAKYIPQYFGPEAGAAAGEAVIADEAEPATVSEPEIAEPAVGFAAEPEIIEPEKPVSFGLADFEAENPASDSNSLAKDIAEPKPTDAVSLEDLEKDLFGPAPDEEAEAETTKKIDKFYTLYRKNEEFQRLLDEEYSRLKGEHIEVPEDDLQVAEVAETVSEKKETAIGTVTEAADDAVPKTAAAAPGFGLEELSAEPVSAETAADAKPVEDATIYQMEMPEELAELAKKAEEDNSGFSVGGEDVKSFGLSGDEVAGAAVAGAAVAAGAAAASKADKKAEKKAAKQAEKQRRKEAAEASVSQVEYENVDAGSTILTILAVIVAVLLVVLLVIILILHIAPNSEIALTIDSIIERITARFSTGDIFGFNKWV